VPARAPTGYLLVRGGARQVASARALQVIDAAPEGVLPRDMPPQPAVFAPPRGDRGDRPAAARGGRAARTAGAKTAGATTAGARTK
jgi:hypothetical protein